jgi:hypothetical protein
VTRKVCLIEIYLSKGNELRVEEAIAATEGRQFVVIHFTIIDLELLLERSYLAQVLPLLGRLK